MSNATTLETNAAVPGHNEVMPPHDQKVHTQYGAAVVHEAKEERSGMLEKLFSNYREACAQTKRDVPIAPVWEGCYESRSVLLRKNSAHMPKTASLTDQVRRLLP
jgi:hypothetical protein